MTRCGSIDKGRSSRQCPEKRIASEFVPREVSDGVRFVDKLRSSNMMRSGRVAGVSILVCLLSVCLDSSAAASPQASKTPSNGVGLKDGAAKSGSQKASTSKEKDAEPPSDTTATKAKAGDAETAPSDKQDGAKDSGKKSPKKMTRAEKKEAAIAEARAAVKEMIRKLGKGEYQEFVQQHIPIDEYVRELRSGQPMKIPLSAIPQLIQMAATLERLQDGDATIDPTGRVVTFKAKEDVKVVKAIENPYSQKSDDVPAYEGDLPEVIAAALKDLKAEKYEDCLSRLIPPSTIHMMKTDGRWDGVMESLSAGSPMVKTMIADLTELSKAEASMDGDMAEFRLPGVIHVVGRRGAAEEEDAEDRVIRFSKINGAWRFYDSNSKTVEELDAALKREVKGEISEDQLVVEKIGSDWRLLRVPGMPPVRPLD